jgi:hypothetical protein
MTASIASITFDSTDPEPLARWWAERFGAEIIANMDGFFVLVAGGTLPAQLAFQKVDDPTPGKNRSTSTSTPTTISTPRCPGGPPPVPPASADATPATSSG